MCTYCNPKPAALNQWLLRICYCHGVCPTSPNSPPKAWHHWVAFSRILSKMPDFIPRLEAPCMQLTATEFHEFTELLLQSFSRRALVLGLMDEQYYVIREAVTEVMWGFQQPRLVLDAQRDLLDRGISRLHWFEFPVPPGVLSPTRLLTAAKQENPCITCRAGKLPICTCIL